MLLFGVPLEGVDKGNGSGHQKEILSTTAVYTLGTVLTQFVSFLLLPLPTSAKTTRLRSYSTR